MSCCLYLEPLSLLKFLDEEDFTLGFMLIDQNYPLKSSNWNQGMVLLNRWSFTFIESLNSSILNYIAPKLSRFFFLENGLIWLLMLMV